MSSYVSPTAALINSAGISAPTYASILSYLESVWLALYGSDVYLGPDSQDAQFLAILAQVISDANAAAISAYQSFSPLTGQGAALAQNVALNGLARLVSSNSTVVVTLTGVAGTVIAAGVVSDTAGNYRWDLPLNAVIGSGGTLTTTATCETPGAIQAAAGTVTGLVAGLALGWQSVTNPAAAAPGAPVESDGALRLRQATSTTLPSLGVMDGVVGALLALPGVVAVAAYTNTTSSTNANGLPAGSICLVVEGGSAAAIAQAIALKKTPGVGTYGSTTVNVTVAWSASPLAINFIVPAQVAVKVAVTLHALSNYTSTIGAEIQAAIAAYINALGIGANVLLTRLYVPASLAGPYAAPASPLDASTFELVSIQIGLVSGSLGTSDLSIGFSSLATCLAASVTITVM